MANRFFVLMGPWFWLCWCGGMHRSLFALAEDNTSRDALGAMNAVSDTASFRSSDNSNNGISFHFLPMMLALSLFINTTSTLMPSSVRASVTMDGQETSSSEIPISPPAAPRVDGVEDSSPEPDSGSVSVTDILNKLLKNYDKRVRPNYGAAAVEVDVTMEITSISSMSEVDMDFTIDFYFRQSWNDPRLVIKKFPNKDGQITVGQEMMNKIWMPDTFFPNEKKSYFHHSTVVNKFLRIQQNGSLYTSVRLTNTLDCELDLTFFPLDYQNCSVEIESYGYATTDIQYFWKRNVVPFDQVRYQPSKLKLPQFKVLSAVPHSRMEGTGTGQYSRLSCEMKFSRLLGYYIIQIYLPSGLIVVISWVSFWLNRESTPARVNLGVITVLTITTLMSSTNAQLPKVSYAKGIDVYLGTCFVMVFASLLEYALVGYSAKRLKMREARIARANQLELSLAAPHPTSFGGSEARLPCSPSRMLQQAHGSNQSLQVQPQSQQTHKFSVGSPVGSEVAAERFSDHGGFRHGRRSVAEFRYKSWSSEQSHGGGGGGGSGHGEQTLSLGLPMNGGLAEQNQLEVVSHAGERSSLSAATKVAPKKKREFKSSVIDKYSRIFFPLVFGLFNVAYWMIYLNISVIPGGRDPERPES
ncbi:Gamma-aminobutyric acid receptor subunit beta [Hypsibius exemplaris]|uniref:Gamma-aminobutyric acid receptor subunit beta n=1 Tax=Hypsibius exemplaris TaxID=2072580 RepID=A0A9X6N8I5_HYPEX|nr:Gamma-aminobutyric acid receptor subunit beta [Hypsibius exemplaris]